MTRQTGIPASSYSVSNGSGNRPAGEIILDPTPVLFNPTWGFRLVLPDGKPDILTGFRNEAEATGWLASGHFIEWLKMRGYARDKVVLASLKER
jgi:hypothetical protein